MWILAQLITEITGNPRYFPDFQWSSTCWTHNVFRFFGMIFGERYGINPSSSACLYQGNEYHYFHSLESLLFYGEQVIRKRIPKKFPVRVSIPLIQLVGGFPIPASPFLFAIAFDAAAGGSNTATLSLGVTAVGTNIAIVAALIGDTGSPSDPTATAGGTSMTLAEKVKQTGDRNLYMFLLANASQGTQNIIETGATFHEMYATSYTGCNNTGQPDSGATGNPVGLTCTYTTTVVASNCWLVGFAYNGTTVVAGAGTTLRGSILDGSSIGDSNGTVGTGSQSLQYVFGNNIEHAGMIISIKPVSSAVVTTPLRSLLGVGL